MKKFLYRFIHGFNDMAYYRKALEDTMRSAFGYLVLLSVLLGLVSGTLMGLQSKSDFRTLAEAIETGRIPYFELENGRLDIDLDAPVVIDQEFQIFIIDTTGTYSLNDLAGYDIGYLVTPERVIVSSRGSDPRAINFADMATVSFNSRDLTALLAALDAAIVFVVLGFTLIAGLVSLLFSSLIAAALFNIFRILSRIPMTFSQAWKIAMFSYAPAVIWQQASHFIPYTVPLLVHYFFLYGFSMLILFRLSMQLLKESRQ